MSDRQSFTDESPLGLEFRPEDRRASRHRRRRQRRRDTGRSVGALLIVLIIFGLLAGGGWYGYTWISDRLTTPDYAGEGSGTVTVQIEEGDTLAQIGRTLVEADVVRSPRAFVEAAEAEPRALGLQPGSYTLRRQMSGRAALALLLDPASRSVDRVTVPEGLTVTETLAVLAEGTGIPQAQWDAAIADPAALGLPEWAVPIPPAEGPAAQPAPNVLEGFLYPETYEIREGESAAALLTRMVAQSLEVYAEIGLVERAAQVGVTPYQVLVIASIVEEEGLLPEDLPRIARVVYNREAQGIRWDMDSTVNYVTRADTLNLTQSDLDIASPYNTRRYRGYPPTPIAASGRAAIEAALAPAAGPWLFFVTVDREGTTRFAETVDEHSRNVEEARRNGLLE